MLHIMIAHLRAVFGREEGQGLIEYALIGVLISIAAIAIMGTLGGTITGVFTDIEDALTP